jgi:hypothetical protein
MTSLQASRTLVKSPPELWAELSELGSLARHLGEFGEIRITQVDPESRVEWEADRASGTVRLEPSGWGTRVVLTVDTPEPAEPEPEPEPAPQEPEAVAVEPEPEPEPVAPAPEPEPVKRRWFSRLFRRTPAPLAPQQPYPEPYAAAPEPEPEPEPEPQPEPDPRERAFGTIEWEIPAEPVLEEPEPEPLQADEAHAVLTSVLDTLGAAHHRPFSRS